MMNTAHKDVPLSNIFSMLASRFSHGQFLDTCIPKVAKGIKYNGVLETFARYSLRFVI
jgi:hypothetical protein